MSACAEGPPWNAGGRPARVHSEPHELDEFPDLPAPGWAVVPARIPVQARFSEHGPALEVSRIGIFVLWLHLPPRTGPGAMAARGEVPIDRGHAAVWLSLGYRTVGPIACDVKHLEVGAEAPRVLCRLRHFERASAIALQDVISALLARGVLAPPQTTIARSFDIQEPAQLRRHVAALCAYRASGQLLPAYGSPWPVRLAGLDSGPLPLRLELDGPAPEPLFQVAVEGYAAVFRFLVERAEVRDGALYAALPDRLAQVRRRWRRRARAPEGLTLCYRHPAWPREEVVRPLRDVSTVGLGMWVVPEFDLLEPGVALDDVAVLYSGEVVCEGKAVVRDVRELPATRSERGDAICGLSFLPRSAGDDARWVNLVHHLLNPTTRSGAVWSLQSWRVYNDSGYFHLSGKQPMQFESLRASFRQVSRGLDAAPWLGCQAVWPSDRGVEATFTFVKVYSDTWFGYQLAKSPDRPDPGVTAPRRVLRELYFRVFEHMQHDRGLRWIAGYLEGSVPWNEVAQFAWARRFQDGEEACLVDFRLLEGVCADLFEEREGDVEVVHGTDADVEALLAHLQETRSRAWRQLLDLDTEDNKFDDIRHLWQSAGLRRDRRIIVARRSGRRVAMAAVETGETGASLFSLLDNVRLFDLAEDSGADAHAALLAAAARGFRTLGKERFVVYEEQRPLEAMLALGLRDLGHGKLWAISRQLLPDFLEHVATLLAPRPEEAMQNAALKAPGGGAR